jgi:hypothetical protein
MSKLKTSSLRAKDVPRLAAGAELITPSGSPRRWAHAAAGAGRVPIRVRGTTLRFPVPWGAHLTD